MVCNRCIEVSETSGLKTEVFKGATMGRSIGVLFLILGFFGFFPRSYAAQPDKRLFNMAKKVESRVSVLRGLPEKKPIKWQITSKKNVRKYIIKSMNEQYGPGEMQNEGLAMKAMELVPADMDYKASVISLLEEQVAGFYDPITEVFYLADWIAPSAQEPIIAHELCHALQDQNFDIDKFVKRDPGNSDAMLARTSVLEGEATLVMILYSMGEASINIDMSMIDLDGPLGSLLVGLSSFQSPEFGKTPKALRNSLLFPYLKGLKFVSYGKKIGGWKEIDKVYSHLPTSTEQVMHPEKFFIHRDDPTTISMDFLKGLPEKPWQKIYEDVMGEFMTGQLLNLLDNSDEQRRGSAGWDGDKVEVFRNGEQLAWIGLWVFDSERDAIEFAGAFSKTVPLRNPGFSMLPTDSNPTMHWITDDGKNCLVSRLNDKVLVVYGFGNQTTQDVLDATIAKFSAHPARAGGL